jgi:DNA-binding NarL/FixJ family response regulator
MTLSGRTVLLADDKPQIRKLLRTILEVKGLEIVGEAINGFDVAEQYATLQPDFVVLDVQMPTMNGIEATGAIRRAFPAAKIILLSMEDRDEYMSRGLESGASAYVLKEHAVSDLITAIETVSQGEIYLSKEIRERRPKDKLPGSD